MDSDEDGIVTFDELKTYCEENGEDISQYMTNWLTFHTVRNTNSNQKE